MPEVFYDNAAGQLRRRMTTRRLPMAKLWAVALLAISFMLDVDCHHAWSQSASSTITPELGIIPAERNFAWNPGLMSKGGIPDRSPLHMRQAFVFRHPRESGGPEPQVTEPAAPGRPRSRGRRYRPNRVEACSPQL